MGKTIIISERQLTEILGADSSYLDSMEGDFKEFNGHTEVSVNGKLSDKSDGEPLTTDEYGSKKMLTNGWGTTARQQPLVMNCGVEKKTLVENLPMGQERTWTIPEELYSQLQNNRQMYNGNKNASGWDRLNNLINQRNVKYNEMKRLKSFFDREAKNDPNNYNLIGGKDMEQWVQNSLKSYRGAVATDKASKSAMGFENVYQKAGGTKNVGNGQAHTKKNNGITYQE